MTRGFPAERTSAAGNGAATGDVATASAAVYGLADSSGSELAREPFDLDGPMTAIMSEGGRSLADISVDSIGREFEAGDDNLIVYGPLPVGAVVRGKRSVLIQGDVAGQPDAPCRIEVRGQVVITGFVSHAHISARSIHIGASVRCSQLSGAITVEITGDVERSRIICGEYYADAEGARSRQTDLDVARQRTDELRQRVAVEEKRLSKACRSIRAPLNLNVGRIITHRDDTVSVDLGTFYRSVEWQTEQDLERALNEFFAKGIIGVLSRINRKYLVEVPTHGKVFMQLMRTLHDLLTQVMACDAAERFAVRRQLELERLVSELECRQPQVSVGGSIAPSVRLEFILPRVIRQADGGIDFAHKMAQLSIHAGSFADQLELVWQHGDGSRGERTALAGDLDETIFVVREEQVRWERVAAAELA